MLTGLPPYYANSKEELFENIKRMPLQIPSFVEKDAGDIIQKLMDRDPKKRLGYVGGLEEIKKHPYF